MRHVFISYAHQNDDTKFVGALCEQLRKAGFEVWMDKESLHDGENWRDAIDENIIQAFALIVVMTPEAKASEYVTYEWSYALAKGIPVIPVLIKPTKLHPRIEVYQFRDFTDDNINPYMPPWDKLTDRLHQLESENLASVLKDLREGNNQIRREAALKLGEIGNTLAIDGLVEVLNNLENDSDVRESALDALIAIGHPSIIEHLINALGDTDNRIKNAASNAFGGYFSFRSIEITSDVVNLLINVLSSNENPNAREEAATIIGRISHIVSRPSRINALAKSLVDDKNVKVRAAAAAALGEIKSADVVPHLMKALRDAEQEVRSRADWSLRNIESPALPSLVDALRDSDSQIRTAVADILRNMGTVSIPYLVDALQNDDNPKVREVAAETLSWIANSDIIPALIDSLKDNNPRVRNSSANALVRIGTAAIPALIESLNSGLKVDALCASIGALGEIGHKEAVPALKKLLLDKRSSFSLQGQQVCDVAAWALYSIGTDDAVQIVEDWWEQRQS